eukprot:456143_1
MESKSYLRNCVDKITIWSLKSLITTNRAVQEDSSFISSFKIKTFCFANSQTNFNMLLFATIAILILLSTISLHYFQHFKLVLCKRIIPLIITRCSTTSFAKTHTPNPNSSISTQSAITRRKSLTIEHNTIKCCKLESVDDEDFNFFPISFLFYMMFILTICLAIIMSDIIQSINSNQNRTILWYIIYEYTPGWESLQIKYFPINELHSIDVNIWFDYIIIYGIMIASIWQSLFNFYRYYTTFLNTKDFQDIAISSILYKFSGFAIIFAILFMAQIHFYYWLFPLVLGLYFGLNWYCSWKFSSVLISRYKLFIAMEGTFQTKLQPDINSQILRSVYLLRKYTLICCIIQSISLGLFVVTYNVQIIHYLPILWCLSCITFIFNFVRNRRFINKYMSKICLIYTNKNNIKSKNINIKHLTVNKPNLMVNNTVTITTTPSKDIKGIIVESPERTDTISYINKPSIKNAITLSNSLNVSMVTYKKQSMDSTLSNNSINNSIDEHTDEDDDKDLVIIEYQNNKTTETLRIDINEPTTSKNENPTPQSTKSNSRTPVNTTPIQLSHIPQSPMSPALSPFSKSVHGMYSNSVSLNMVVVSGQKVLRRSIATENKTDILHNVQNENDDIDIGDLDIEDENSKSMDENNKHLQIDTLKQLKQIDSLKKPPLEMKHSRSNSLPIDINEYIEENPQIDINQVIRSFNMLSKYGFCQGV